MDRLLSPDTFEFLARYFVAGWVFLSVRSWWIRGERPKPNEVLFEAITLSLLNQLLSLITVPLLISRVMAIGGSPALIVEILIQPALAALVAGYFAQLGWIPEGLRLLLMPALQPVSSALGFAVDQIDGPSFIIVTYEDGRQVYGYFGENSFARSEGVGAMFIETLYHLDEEEAWIAAEPRRSGWVTLNGVQTIEFISGKDL
jgi:hypothetical protein